MISLYAWLIQVKNYSESESEETVLRYSAGMPLPDDVKKDIKEYTSLFIQSF